MKKQLFLLFYLTLILTFFIAQMGWCQNPILPLSTYKDIPNGAYLKDLDNVLLPYVGTWEGILNGKTYTFVFTKFPQHDNFGRYYEDELKCKFRVTDLATGSIIYDNLTATSSDDVTKKVNKKTDQDSYDKIRDFYEKAKMKINC